MKKVVRCLSVLAVALCLCLSLTACGATGKYKGTYENSDEEYSEKTTITIELKKDDKFEMTMEYELTMDGETEKGSEKESGTYKIDGDKITLTIDGEDVTCDFKKGKWIKFDFDGEIVELKK